MSKNDDRILELKKQIEDKKQSLTVKKTRFIPETNCVLDLDGERYNINVLDANSLLTLMLKINFYNLSADSLKVTHPTISGYTTDLWIGDIRNKMLVLDLKKEESELKQMESKLDKLLSEDKKTELEIDGIAALLR